MIKVLRKYLDIELITLSLMMAFIYCVLFNMVVFSYKFGYYKVTFLKAVLELGKDFVYIYIFTFIIFLGLTIQRLIFITGTILLFITGALASYYLCYFKISPTKEMIGSLLSTHINELYEITSSKLLIWLGVGIFIGIYSIKYFSFANNKLFIQKLLSFVCIVITITNIIAPQFKLLTQYFPIQYLHNSYLYFSMNKIIAAGYENINQNFAFIDKADDNLIVVLVIGESARFDHLGINGYPKDTTPYLTTITNLFSFKAQASSNHTYIAVPSIMSRYSSKDLDKSLKETSFLSVFADLGFNTYWIGTQTLLQYLKSKKQSTIYDEVKFVMLPGGSTLLKMNDYDEKMLPYIEKFLDSSTGKQVIVVHMSGSHWNYSARYPKEFQKFTPGCNQIVKSDPSTCNIEGLVNDYDNSILYTDFFLFSLVKLLKNRNAFLIYVSDHAESLGENGYYGHGGPLIPEQTTILLIVWVSDKFNMQHPELVKSVKTYLGSELSHDYIFHSILDCAGIQSTAINKNLSLCGKQRNG
ncbi:phosphoethanolamine transferase [Candidatus Tisiphia endosymbiont of Nemotelus uliginosus]|uniref:phosphoethanolamine transferase n=1 Tax=Candidatus Tisiphia endosymbiont of Nemotelus uliginosus TaxID=3077926 RepID=UPI0035C8E3C5